MVNYIKHLFYTKVQLKDWHLLYNLQHTLISIILPFSNSRVSGEHFSLSVPSNLSESENIISPCYLIFQTRQLMKFQYA